MNALEAILIATEAVVAREGENRIRFSRDGVSVRLVENDMKWDDGPVANQLAKDILDAIEAWEQEQEMRKEGS